jgi:prolyl-tRNA editing enzyme YbaK/EbsC (Cys-tRNA(Pro) deacylase)
MSKSLRRVVKTLEEAGIEARVLAMDTETRTAEQAAAAAGCTLDQIVKSIVFRGEITGGVTLFLTAGGNRVDPVKAADVAGEPLGRADALLVRERTGFAIGGVSPVGHPAPIPTFWDPRLSDFAVIYAAAGTPRHIFSVAPGALQRFTGARTADFTG